MLQVLKKCGLLLLPAVLLCGCEKFDVAGFVSNPSDDVEMRFEQSMAWNEAHRQVTMDVPTDEYRYYVATDIHVNKTTNNLTTFLTAERNDTLSYFSLLLGDFVDIKGQFSVFYPALAYNLLTQLKEDTLFTTVGNHDLYFDQWKDYVSCFGTSTYYFLVRTPNYVDLFIALDSGSGTIASSQLEWVKDVLSELRGKCRHCVVFTHSNFFRNDISQIPSGNFMEEETYELTNLFAKYNVDLVLTGHDHTKDVTSYRGVTYVIGEALKDAHATPGYLIVHQGEFVDLDFRYIE